MIKSPPILTNRARPRRLLLKAVPPGTAGCDRHRSLTSGCSRITPADELPFELFCPTDDDAAQPSDVLGILQSFAEQFGIYDIIAALLDQHAIAREFSQSEFHSPPRDLERLCQKHDTGRFRRELREDYRNPDSH